MHQHGTIKHYLSGWFTMAMSLNKKRAIALGLAISLNFYYCFKFLLFFIKIYIDFSIFFSI
jgi:hypothetical protein